MKGKMPSKNAKKNAVKVMWFCLPLSTFVAYCSSAKATTDRVVTCVATGRMACARGCLFDEP